MGTQEKGPNCPDGFCEKDHRGYGGCLDENVRTKEEAIARLRSLGLEQMLKESLAVQERTIKLIKAAAQREGINEDNLVHLIPYMQHSEIESEVLHMYERNELALRLYEDALAGSLYSDKLVHEVAMGLRGKKNDSEEAIAMSQA